MPFTYQGFHVLGYSSYADTDAGDFADYKAMIDQVKAEKSWTILYFQGIYPGRLLHPEALLRKHSLKCWII